MAGDRQPAWPSTPWFAPLSIDLFLTVLNKTLFHWFISFLIPLCLLALAHPLYSVPVIVSVLWSVIVCASHFANSVSQWVAYGSARSIVPSEEVIVITGGGSGLGRLVAEVYGLRGQSVAVLDQIGNDAELEDKGISFYECDIGDKDQVMEAAKKIEKDLGVPTVLVNNAAIVVGKSLLHLSLDEIDRSLATNLLGPFYCLKAFLPFMTRSERGGTIVNISSVIGHLGAAQLTDYAAAKAGITALHTSLTAELGQTHPKIKTVLVTPGQLSTPLFYGVESPNSFIAPVVEPVEICKEIVTVIDSGRGGSIGLPFYARWVDWYKVLPAGVQILARKVAGVDRGMRTFVGRDGINSLKGKST